MLAAQDTRGFALLLARADVLIRLTALLQVDHANRTRMNEYIPQIMFFLRIKTTHENKNNP